MIYDFINEDFNFTKCVKVRTPDFNFMFCSLLVMLYAMHIPNLKMYEKETYNFVFRKVMENIYNRGT